MGLVRSAALMLPRAAANAATLPLHAARTARPRPGRPWAAVRPDVPAKVTQHVQSTLETTVRTALRDLPEKLGELPGRAELENLFGERSRRRIWARDGRAYIGMRGLAGRFDEGARRW